MADTFQTLLIEVDMQRLSLRPHKFEWYHWWTGQRWNQVFACTECGIRYEGWWHADQICLGVIGELMLAKEEVPKQWTQDFEERRRLARRAWRAKHKPDPKPRE